MSEAFMETVKASIIQGPEIKVKCDLPAHHRLVILTFDSPPLIVPIDDPGTYEIDLEATTPVSRWPAAVFAVKIEHVHLFEEMAAAMSDGWLNELVREMHRHAS